MRNGCQWCLALLLLAGCGGTPGGRSAAPPADTTAVSGALPSPDSAVGITPMEAVAETSAGGSAMPEQVRAASARRFLTAHPEALVLDVRNPDEWNDDLGHIDRARQIPLPELAARQGEIEAWKDKPIVVVCRAGGRSREAALMLRGAGFRQVMNLEGGMLAWRSSEKVAKLR